MLAPDGTPASLIRAWQRGEFEWIASPALLDELSAALAYPRIKDRLDPSLTAAVIDRIERLVTLVPDPADPPPVAPSDPDDAYLVALAAGTRAVIVTGDRGLLELAPSVPVFSPAEFAALLKAEST